MTQKDNICIWLKAKRAILDRKETEALNNNQYTIATNINGAKSGIQIALDKISSTEWISEEELEDKATTCLQLLSNACNLEEIKDEVLFVNILIETFKSL